MERNQCRSLFHFSAQTIVANRVSFFGLTRIYVTCSDLLRCTSRPVFNTNCG